MGWVKTQRIGPGGSGYTFEALLGKEEDNFSFPDFEGIEIKTTNQFVKEFIHLFCATPDGDFLYPINRIIDLLGYPDKDYPEHKVFNITVSAGKYVYLYGKKVILFVNRIDRKVQLLAKDKNNQPIDIDVSWSFEMLERKLFIKMKNLAVIKTEKKRLKGAEYYYYKEINMYELKGFNKFIDLIEDGTVQISFKISIFKSGKRFGKTHDRGTAFSIYEKDIKKLYYGRIIDYSNIN